MVAALAPCSSLGQESGGYKRLGILVAVLSGLYRAGRTCSASLGGKQRLHLSLLGPRQIAAAISTIKQRTENHTDRQAYCGSTLTFVRCAAVVYGMQWFSTIRLQ